MGVDNIPDWCIKTYQDFCSECCNKCKAVPDGYCPTYCLILQKGALIPFERIQESYIRNKGDLNKVCGYIKRYKLMKPNELDKFIGKKVRVVFTSKVYLEGFLGYGDINLGVEWIGTGYHLTVLKNKHIHFCGFKKSHVKKIEEIP